MVVDFYAPELRLAVELDGSWHELRRRRDRRRDRELDARGIRVVRVASSEVFRDIEGVLARIRVAIAERRSELGTD